MRIWGGGGKGNVMSVVVRGGGGGMGQGGRGLWLGGRGRGSGRGVDRRNASSGKAKERWSISKRENQGTLNIPVVCNKM